MATTTHRTRSAGHDRLERLGQLLTQQDAVLRSRRRTLQAGLLAETSGVMDIEEHALAAEEQGLSHSVLELTSRAVQEIEMALRRLRAGALGRCSECRARIKAARLRALPSASLCLPCQHKHDIAEAAASQPGGSR
jgi:DnaK suppressor protein